MVTLRPRERKTFTCFTAHEIETMEGLLKEPGEQSLDRELYMRLAKRFNRCKDRAGKPDLKWAEVETWFRNRQQSDRLNHGISVNSAEKLSSVPEACLKEVQQIQTTSKGTSLSRQQSDWLKHGISVNSTEKLSAVPEACSNNVQQIQTTSKVGVFGDAEAEEKVPDLSALEFEARSATDGAWYDVDTFLSCRYLSSGGAEVLVRYEGFGAEDDEWVNVKKDIRERSLPLEHSECGKLKVGDLVVCFQESKEIARYFDAHILSIQRKMHDIRGCRCLFLIRYDHDATEERVQLNRLCCRPSC